MRLAVSQYWQVSRTGNRLLRRQCLAMLMFVFASLAAAINPPVGQFSKYELLFTHAVRGNPFDFRVNNMVARITLPDATRISVPCFYDGADLWRMRYAPVITGDHRIEVLLNGRPLAEQPAQRTFRCVQSKRPGGIVRYLKQFPMHWQTERGDKLLLAGINAAWLTPGDTDYRRLFDAMRRSGVALARLWMTHWGGMNLEWRNGEPSPPIGEMSLKSARFWDEIVEHAEQRGVYLQVTLQHHGQYSTRVNSNWEDNPFNEAAGGFLSRPDNFFTDTRAIELTERKYRYIIARWGYSPHIMSWELFNEVIHTDAARNGHWDSIMAWHERMATFLKKWDWRERFVTTSDSPQTYRGFLDFYQLHTYPLDIVDELAGIRSAGYDRPIFFGEWGPANLDAAGYESVFHRGLWAGLMSDTAALPMWWAWDQLTDGRFAAIRTALGFAKKAGISTMESPRIRRVEAASLHRGPLRIVPRKGWEATTIYRIDVTRGGGARGADGVSAYVQGDAHREWTTRPIELAFEAVEKGTIRISIGEIARSGAAIEVRLNGEVTYKETLGADTEPRVIELAHQAGRHILSLHNPGSDWFALRWIELSDAAPELLGFGRWTTDRAVIWLCAAAPSNDAPIEGASVTLEGLATGEYTATWHDTITGKILGTGSVRTANGRLVLPVRTFRGDIATVVVRAQK